LASSMDNTLVDRIVNLNDRPVDPGGLCVVYWMQRSQRAADNPALNCAVQLANDLGKPVLVYFGLHEAYPMASVRAFQFMLEGLRETAAELESRGIGFVIRREHPQDGIVRAAQEFTACAVVVDEDYLNTGRSWRSHAASRLDVRLIQVDAETVVPARVSGKEEWGAYTLRPKIKRALPDYFTGSADNSVEHRWTCDFGESLDIRKIDPGILARSLSVDQDVAPTKLFKGTPPPSASEGARGRSGGASQAERKLREFIQENLPRYAGESNQIGVSVTSDLSPYLHFGQVSARMIGLAVESADAPGECIDAFLEQLIVRRELGINFCLYNPNYDNLDAAPDWARKTLDAHRLDDRPELYALEELESASTHDELWNAAQTELIQCGRIHGYMRMVWAKSILRWSPAPEEALARCIYLNDKYALDGRDPNGYVNIAWSIFGKADRAFGERPIFGKIRYMSTEATKRKFDWRSYIRRVEDGGSYYESI